MTSSGLSYYVHDDGQTREVSSAEYHIALLHLKEWEQFMNEEEEGKNPIINGN